MSSTRIKKPVMSRNELSRQVAIEGARAVKAASRQGGDPAVIRAMADASAGNTILPPPALNVMVALEGWWQSRAREKAGNILDMAANAFCFQKPDEAIQAMQDGEDTFVRAARAHSATVSIETLRALVAEITRHIHTVFQAGGSVEDAVKETGGKKPRKRES